MEVNAKTMVYKPGFRSEYMDTYTWKEYDGSRELYVELTFVAFRHVCWTVFSDVNWNKSHTITKVFQLWCVDTMAVSLRELCLMKFFAVESFILLWIYSAKRRSAVSLLRLMWLKETDSENLSFCHCAQIAFHHEWGCQVNWGILSSYVLLH